MVFCFEDVLPFSDSLAGVRKDGKWGFINADGRFVIEPIYDSVGSFSNGYAKVGLNGKFGFINLNGEVVIDINYVSAYRANGRSELVLCDDEKTYVYNTDLNMTHELDAVYSRIELHESGLIIVYDSNGWGLLDADGSVLLEANFVDYVEYSDLHAIVFQKNDYYKDIYVVNYENGINIFQYQDVFILSLNDHTVIPVFCDGIALEELDIYQYVGYRANIYDINGNLLFEKHDNKLYYEQAFYCPLEENLATYAMIYVDDSNGKHGIISSDNKILVEAEYDRISPFYKDYPAVAVKNGKIGLITTEYEFVPCEALSALNNPSTAIFYEWYYIENGKIEKVINAKITDVNGSGDEYFIDTTGKVVEHIAKGENSKYNCQIRYYYSIDNKDFDENGYAIFYHSSSETSYNLDGLVNENYEVVLDGYYSIERIKSNGSICYLVEERGKTGKTFKGYKILNGDLEVVATHKKYRIIGLNVSTLY